MPCIPFRFPGGGSGFVCARGRRAAPCDVCKREPHSKLCDFPLRGKKAGKACDRKLCDACAVTVGRAARQLDLLQPGTEALGPLDDTIDYCPAHARLAEKGKP